MASRSVSKSPVSGDFNKQLMGYGADDGRDPLSPSGPSLATQSYVWQNYDLFPNFPALKDFLAFWQEKLEGRCSRSRSRIRG